MGAHCSIKRESMRIQRSTRKRTKKQKFLDRTDGCNGCNGCNDKCDLSINLTDALAKVDLPDKDNFVSALGSALTEQINAHLNDNFLSKKIKGLICFSFIISLLGILGAVMSCLGCLKYKENLGKLAKSTL